MLKLGLFFQVEVQRWIIISNITDGPKLKRLEDELL